MKYTDKLKFRHEERCRPISENIYSIMFRVDCLMRSNYRRRLRPNITVEDTLFSTASQPHCRIARPRLDVQAITIN